MSCGLTLNLLFASASLTSFVDPFVGTAGTGHTTPAACVPFGLIQAGPDTGYGNWAYTSGYVYGDTNLVGFSQTHLSGTGCGDLGDVRLLPFTGNEVPEFLPMAKASEKAEPGYYTVIAGGVKTEITATARVASYRFTFPKGAKKRLLVDPQWGVQSWGKPTNRVRSAEVAVTNKTIAGTLEVKQWNRRQVSFVVRPNQSAVTAITELARRPGERASRYVVDFTADDKPVFVNVALSADSVEAARLNLVADRVLMDLLNPASEQAFFDRLVELARMRWQELLSVATIEGTEEQKKNWYTALYHLCVQPNLISDANPFSSVRQNPVYSTFSTWDTFRAAGPLYTLLYPEFAGSFVDSMLREGQNTGFLPIWTLWGSDNQCMIGTHSIPMIVDWFLKEKVEKIGEGGQSSTSTKYWESAYAQIKDTLTQKHEKRQKEQWEIYDRYGYYPFDLVKDESVSRTLECAYDDWCAAQMAKALGKSDDYAFFMKRASYWKNVLDPETLFVRGKDSQGNWRDPFNPYSFGFGHGSRRDCDYTEGNAFQYTWHVMQDAEGLIAAMGGREATLKKLSALFEAPENTKGAPPDVSGLIGQYVHGNEPSHHVIYFFTLLGRNDLAAKYVREVFDRFYLPKPDGLCGNDDCGQMSAWYLFSAMGFYPFNPCGGEYVLGAPQVEKVVIKVEKRGGGGQRKNDLHCPPNISTSTSFTIIAKNLSKENKYVKSVTLNGKPITNGKIRHEDILAGGELVFEMSL